MSPCISLLAFSHCPFRHFDSRFIFAIGFLMMWRAGHVFKISVSFEFVELFGHIFIYCRPPSRTTYLGMPFLATGAFSLAYDSTVDNFVSGSLSTSQKLERWSTVIKSVPTFSHGLNFGSCGIRVSFWLLISKFRHL